MIAIEAMAHARRVALLQEVRLEYGFRQYLKSYCYDCIKDVDVPYTRMIHYKEYTFCSEKCATRAMRVRCKRQKRNPSMNELCQMYQSK